MHAAVSNTLLMSSATVYFMIECVGELFFSLAIQPVHHLFQHL